MVSSIELVAEEEFAERRKKLCKVCYCNSKQKPETAKGYQRIEILLIIATNRIEQVVNIVPVRIGSQPVLEPC